MLLVLPVFCLAFTRKLLCASHDPYVVGEEIAKEVKDVAGMLARK